MGSFARTRTYAQQVCVLAVAMVGAILLLSLAPVAKGEPSPHQKVDREPSGAPYVAGELLVAYRPGTPENAEQAVVRGSGGQTAEKLSEEMRLVTFPRIKQEGLEKARERAIQRKLEHLRADPDVEAADYNHIYRAAFQPDDPRFSGQWGLEKTRFPRAWDFARGKGARIAVVDSGIDQNHPDLSAKVVEQKDYVDGNKVANDPYGHGTHVAGIAAALTNNGKGVAGGCPACKLLVARVLNGNGDTTAARLVKGINWSANKDADVINLSLAGPSNGDLKIAVDDARASGAVIVAAAGNKRPTCSDCSARQYPAAYRKVIAVSATNERDGLADISRHGNWVDLAAPGTNILSTKAGGGYDRETGTSESAPFVSALAGLLASKGKSASEIRQRMQSTATDLGAPGDDPYFGHGRINAKAAVR